MSIAKQFLVIALIAGAGYLGYLHLWPLVQDANGRAAVEETSEDDARATPVIVEAVEYRRERVRIEAVGTAEAIRSATLYAASAGQVTAVNIAPNQRVEKGEILVELEKDSEELAIDLARVRVKDARQLLQRYESTAGTGAVPESTIDEARTALEEAQIELRQAQVALADRVVRAPFSGYVSMTDVEVGDRIDTDDPITRLDDRGELLIGFTVPELFLERVAIGEPVTVATWAAREQRIEGRIVDLGSRVDPQSRSFFARARIANENDRLRPGMSFAVLMDLFGKSYPMVPEVAVQWGGDGAYLWAVREGRAHRVLVRIVQRRKGSALVDADVAAGEPVVVEGIQRMRDGLEVSLVARDPDA